MLTIIHIHAIYERVYLYIKLLEKRFSFTFPKGLSDYFSGEKNKMNTFLINKKTFIIAKISEKKCSKNDLDIMLKKQFDL